MGRGSGTGHGKASQCKQHSLSCTSARNPQRIEARAGSCECGTKPISANSTHSCAPARNPQRIEARAGSCECGTKPISASSTHSRGPARATHRGSSKSRLLRVWHKANQCKQHSLLRTSARNPQRIEARAGSCECGGKSYLIKPRLSPQRQPAYRHAAPEPHSTSPTTPFLSSPSQPALP